jgi:hypothetical protein
VACGHRFAHTAFVAADTAGIVATALQSALMSVRTPSVARR